MDDKELSPLDIYMERYSANWRYDGCGRRFLGWLTQEELQELEPVLYREIEKHRLLDQIPTQEDILRELGVQNGQGKRIQYHWGLIPDDYRKIYKPQFHAFARALKARNLPPVGAESP